MSDPSHATATRSNHTKADVLKGEIQAIRREKICLQYETVSKEKSESEFVTSINSKSL